MQAFDSSGKNSDDFTIDFQPIIELDGKYEMALIELAYVYSMRNIDSSFSNNTFRYSPDNGANYLTVTFPGGVFSVSAMNDYLHQVMKANTHFDEGATPDLDVYDLSLTLDNSTGLVVQECKTTYRFDFATGDFNLLIGAAKAVVSTTISGPNTPLINRGIISYRLNCDVIDSVYNGSRSQTFGVFQPNVAPTFATTHQPNVAFYMPINKIKLNKIRFYFTDQEGKPISFFGEKVVIVVDIRKIKE